MPFYRWLDLRQYIWTSGRPRTTNWVCFDPNDGHYKYSAVTSNLDFTLANLWRFTCGRGNHEC